MTGDALSLFGAVVRCRAMSNRIKQLGYSDQELARLALPGSEMRVLRGIGSGLSKSPDGRVWAIGDRGPNLKVKLAVER
jgi:hypothetical protein